MIILGMYREKNGADYPPMKDCISDLPIPEKKIVLKYLRSFKPIAAAPTTFKDVLTGERIRGEALSYSDGTYTWRSDLIYYVDKYNFNLPNDFVAMVLAKSK